MGSWPISRWSRMRMVRAGRASGCLACHRRAIRGLRLPAVVPGRTAGLASQVHAIRGPVDDQRHVQPAGDDPHRRAGHRCGPLFLTTNAPARTPELTLGMPESVECPFGSGVPVCYRYDLVNTGTAPAFVRCEVTPAGDSTAVFGNGETSYEGTEALEAGAGWHLTVQVEAGAGDVVSEPMVGCGQVS